MLSVASIARPGSLILIFCFILEVLGGASKFGKLVTQVCFFFKFEIGYIRWTFIIHEKYLWRKQAAKHQAAEDLKHNLTHQTCAKILCLQIRKFGSLDGNLSKATCNFAMHVLSKIHAIYISIDFSPSKTRTPTNQNIQNSVCFRKGSSFW